MHAVVFFAEKLKEAGSGAKGQDAKPERETDRTGQMQVLSGSDLVFVFLFQPPEQKINRGDNDQGNV